MGFWQDLFGPSKLDTVLEMWREDRAATNALMSRFLDNSKSQADVVRQHYELLKVPAGAPEVRLMTPVEEARHEQQRHLKPRAQGTPLDTETLLAEFGRDFTNSPHPH